MANGIDNIVIEQLKAIRSELSDVNRKIGNVEKELITNGRHTAILVDGQANSMARFAELETRLERIEKRLGLIEA